MTGELNLKGVDRKRPRPDTWVGTQKETKMIQKEATIMVFRLKIQRKRQSTKLELSVMKISKVRGKRKENTLKPLA